MVGENTVADVGEKRSARFGSSLAAIPPRYCMEMGRGRGRAAGAVNGPAVKGVGGGEWVTGGAEWGCWRPLDPWWGDNKSCGRGTEANSNGSGMTGEGSLTGNPVGPPRGAIEREAGDLGDWLLLRSVDGITGSKGGGES